jgi:hypothetical protein
MISSYKETVLLGLLRNPCVLTPVKERILRGADDSWNWLLTFDGDPPPEQQIQIQAELLDHKLTNVAEESIKETEFENNEIDLSDDLQEAIIWFLKQPHITLNSSIQILNKFEQYEFRWNYYGYVIDSALKNPKNKTAFANYFLNSTNRYFVEGVASHPGTPLECLDTLSKSSNTDVLQALATNPAASKTLLRTLVKDHGEFVMLAMDENPNLPEEFMLTIANSDHRSSKISLSQRDDLSEDVLRILSFDEDEYIRSLIARRKVLPSDVLTRLISDPDESVRVEIAKRSDLSPEFVRQLYLSRSIEIDYALAGNPTISDEMRDAFVLSNDPELLGAAFMNPRLTKFQIEKLQKEKNKKWMKNWSFSGKNLSAEACAILAKSKDAEKRERIARLENLPEDLIAELAKDVDAEIRTAIAEHPKCTDAILKAIIARHDEDGDFHLPLRITDKAKSSEILELMFDRLMLIHAETIAQYKKLKADGETSFIVPRDFRSLKRFYNHPLASDRIKNTVAEIYPHLAMHDQGLALADNLSTSTSSTESVLKTLNEIFSDEGSEEFLAGFVSSSNLNKEAIDYLLVKLAVT